MNLGSHLRAFHPFQGRLTPISLGLTQPHTTHNTSTSSLLIDFNHLTYSSQIPGSLSRALIPISLINSTCIGMTRPPTPTNQEGPDKGPPALPEGWYISLAALPNTHV